MNNFPLNCIIRTDKSWSCNVFEFDRINVGGLWIDYRNFEEMEVDPIKDCSVRIYKKTKKIIITSDVHTDCEFGFIKLNYDFWKCLICRKISSNAVSKCFCPTYSTCWTPINGKVSGIHLSPNCYYDYHFDDNTLNII